MQLNCFIRYLLAYLIVKKWGTQNKNTNISWLWTPPCGAPWLWYSRPWLPGHTLLLLLQSPSSHTWESIEGTRPRYSVPISWILIWIFEDIIMFANISVLVTFQFWWHFSFSDNSVLVKLQFWLYFSFDEALVFVTFLFCFF